ncbi:hypothetical protein IJJ18_00250 [Candidatus Saccharibacteria bacterium]|nr:hypothetical protein [Candidatus Saccharibacteria bacterium]
MVVLACKLSGFDVVYRSSAWEYKPVSKINPNKKTIGNIKTMIDRTSTYVSKCKPIIESGFIISDCGGKYVTVGDGDLLTEDSIIDFKVSTRPPTSDHTLQLLIYYIAGLHKDFEKFKNVKKLIIFNPRLNISYTYNLHNLEDWIFNEVEKNIIGISPHKSFKEIPHC